ncbi:MAG: acyl-CoA/acyl-ACP dehydrogenase [Desulfobacterales bacterium]|nr:acyl-CoA/acyl-ACP dehydrogenase [Desulfobacterales bacterium]
MELFFSTDENEFRKKLAQFLKAELAPIAEDIALKDEIPFQFIKALAVKGYMGILHSKEYGGTEQGIIYDSITSEEICYYSAAVDITRSVSALYFGVPIAHWGTDDQKRSCLPSIIKGEKFGSLAITEPRGGSDVAGMTTRAVKDGDNYILNGEKTWITNANFGSFICVFAISNPDVHGHEGMTAFLVETDNPGYKVVRDLKGMGVQGTAHSHIAFENCVVPKANVIGEVDRGWDVLMDELVSERINIASRSLGCARRAFEESVRYTAEREQFKRPIRHFEGVSFKIADMQTLLDASRLLIMRAARMYDQGIHADKEVAVAKLYASEAAFNIAHMAMQVHGSYGYSKDSVVERIFRDTRVYGFGGGTSEIMRFLIQREVYKEFGLIKP